MASYVSGNCGDEEFLSQPHRLCAQGRLMLYRGLRREREGRPAEALASYRKYVALPLWRRAEECEPVNDRFARWRIEWLSSP